MRRAGLANILLLTSSGFVLGLPKNVQIQENNEDAGGVISGDFWWMQGTALQDKHESSALDSLSNIFNQAISTFNNTLLQDTSQITFGSTLSPHHSQNPSLVPSSSPITPLHTQDTSDVKDTCSTGLHCRAIESCKLYNGSIKADVEQYDNGQKYFVYDTGNVIFWFKKCNGAGEEKRVCCKTKSSSQQKQDSGPYNTENQNPGPYSGVLNAKCANNQDCIPYFQCNNGVIKTNGAGIINIRTQPRATCTNPKYPDASTVCCDIPGAQELSISTNAPPSAFTSTYVPTFVAPANQMTTTCDGYKVCVNQELCDASGNIITDGGGLIDLRIAHKRCNVDGTIVGVCCTPPGSPKLPTPQIDSDDLNTACAINKLCVPYFQCSNGVVNTNGAGIINLRTQPIANCFNSDYPDVPAICCDIPEAINSTFPPTSVSLENYTCEGHKICVNQGLCDASGNIIEDGAGLIDLRILHKHCYVDGSSEVGVCCNPPGN